MVVNLDCLFFVWFIFIKFLFAIQLLVTGATRETWSPASVQANERSLTLKIWLLRPRSLFYLLFSEGNEKHLMKLMDSVVNLNQITYCFLEDFCETGKNIIAVISLLLSQLYVRSQTDTVCRWRTHAHRWVKPGQVDILKLKMKHFYFFKSFISRLRICHHTTAN